jgi:hypothetical protein
MDTDFSRAEFQGEKPGSPIHSLPDPSTKYCPAGWALRFHGVERIRQKLFVAGMGAFVKMT